MFVSSHERNTFLKCSGSRKQNAIIKPLTLLYPNQSKLSKLFIRPRRPSRDTKQENVWTERVLDGKTNVAEISDDVSFCFS